MYKAAINVLGPLTDEELSDARGSIDTPSGLSSYAASTGTSMGSAVLRCLATLRQEYKPSQKEYVEWVAESMAKVKILSDTPMQMAPIGEGLRDSNKVFFAVVYLVPVNFESV